MLTLVEVLLNPLRFAEQEGGVFLGNFHELPEDFHRREELLGEFFVVLILPGRAQRGEPGLKLGGLHLDIFVEALQLGREAPDLFGVHDCLSHRFTLRLRILSEGMSRGENLVYD